MTTALVAPSKHLVNHHLRRLTCSRYSQSHISIVSSDLSAHNGLVLGRRRPPHSSTLTSLPSTRRRPSAIMPYAQVHHKAFRCPSLPVRQAGGHWIAGLVRRAAARMSDA